MNMRPVKDTIRLETETHKLDLSAGVVVWINPNHQVDIPFKGGNPAAGSPTATLLRLHPSHRH